MSLEQRWRAERGTGSKDRTLASRRLRRVIWASLAGALALLAASLWRGYSPELSVVTGIAVGAFAFALLGTVERMRPLR